MYILGLVFGIVGGFITPALLRIVIFLVLVFRSKRSGLGSVLQSLSKKPKMSTLVRRAIHVYTRTTTIMAAYDSLSPHCIALRCH